MSSRSKNKKEKPLDRRRLRGLTRTYMEDVVLASTPLPGWNYYTVY